MATRATKAKATPAVDALTCPECGKTFTRAAALGAHRKMTHGVAGSSKNATGKRKTTTTRTLRSSTASSSSTAASNGSARRRTSTSNATGSSANGVDRNALLRTIFPNGIPPREDVMAQANAWLDEAERLARSR
jgi:Zinc finger, C2H2 type